MKKLVLSLGLSIVLLGACQKNSSTYTPDCSGPEKSFSNDVFPIFQNSCFACHSNFGSYSKISADKNAIRNMVADGIMPQQGSLSDVQKNSILCWIDSGAPNN
jgi:hypothetical protein